MSNKTKHLQTETECGVGYVFLFPESQKHIFHCSDIRNKLDFINFSELNYEMIYDDINRQEKIAKVYHLMLEARKYIFFGFGCKGAPCLKKSLCREIFIKKVIFEKRDFWS